MSESIFTPAATSSSAVAADSGAEQSARALPEPKRSRTDLTVHGSAIGSIDPLVFIDYGVAEEADNEDDEETHRAIENSDLTIEEKYELHESQLNLKATTKK